MLGSETPRELAFSQVAQRGVEPAHRSGAGGDEIVMTFRQQSQHGDMVFDGDVVQVRLRSATMATERAS